MSEDDDPDEEDEPDEEPDDPDEDDAADEEDVAEVDVVDVEAVDCEVVDEADVEDIPAAELRVDNRDEALETAEIDMRISLIACGGGSATRVRHSGGADLAIGVTDRPRRSRQTTPYLT